MQDVGKDKPGNSVRAVERALDILTAFGAEDTELTVTDLLKRVDLSRPTLYRLLYTLEQKGFISSEGDPQRFCLGPAVGRLSWAWSSSINISQHALPTMQEIWRLTGETVALFIPQGAIRVCIAELPSTNPLSFKRGVGHSERIALGASGRALLAWLDFTEDDLVAYCKGLPLTPDTLRKQLEEVRKKGYATGRNEILEGAAAIAVPFFHNNGKILGSVAIFGPAVRMDESRLEQIAPIMQDLVRKLSESLGHKHT